jgi:hypothetical protein
LFYFKLHPMSSSWHPVVKTILERCYRDLEVGVADQTFCLGGG